MAIFEEESQDFQDESYRAHLDRNWSNGNKKIEAQDANVQAIVNILTKYDVPIQIVNGKVVETEEGE